jgi:ChrR Cupin-like domain
MTAARQQASVRKPHLEMITVGLDDSWQPMPGLRDIECKPLVDDLDETARTGSRTRLVRFAPGAFTSGQFSHTYWEEFFLLSGDFEDLARGLTHQAHVYSCRPPGTPHGPFRSDGGCVIFEVQYYPA